MLETRLIQTKEGEEFVSGYFLTIDQIHKFLIDYLNDSYGDRIPNDQIYIMRWLNENTE
jgi:hypothetical protein